MGITKEDLIKFINSIDEGKKISTPKGDAKVLNKFPHIVLTDKGSFQWVDIYIKEKGEKL